MREPLNLAAVLRTVAAMRLRCAPIFLFAAVAACGGAEPAPPPPPRVAPPDVFHGVFLRGTPAPDGARGRVALTFDAVTPCTAEILARLKAPRPGAAPRVGTFFVRRQALEAMAATDAKALRAALARMVSEGHEIALGLDDVPSAWRGRDDAFRVGLAQEARAVVALLRAHGVEEPGPLRLWRPPPAAITLPVLARAAAVDRPAALWSVWIDEAEPGALGARFAARVGDGDLVALIDDGRTGCALAEAIPAIDAALSAGELDAVGASALLGRALDRYEPARVVRYVGPGLPSACLAPLEIEASGAPGPAPTEPAVARWGLVDADLEDAVRVLPLPGEAGGTATLVTDALPEVRRLWRQRARWRGLPACLRRVPVTHVVAPLVASGAERWWIVGPDGLSHREPRAVDAPGRPVVLPTRADLVRLEARQHLPWRLRGLVAGALEGLGLDAPLLIEARATTGVVIGAALSPAALSSDDPAGEARAALAGYVQLLEVSLGEYLFLADWSPGDAALLERTARASDGFMRAGPFLTLSVVPGGAPDPAHVGTDGAAAMGVPPEGMVLQVLRAGASLQPGDVVAAQPRAVVGAPAVALPQRLGSGRSALRRLLALSIVRGLQRGAYLRPGHVWHADGDLLGRQTLRIAVAPGIAVPSGDATPLVEQAPGEDNEEPRR